MTESLYGLLVALSLLAAYRLVDAPGTGRAIVLGTTLGLAALTRGEVLLLLPLVLVPVLRRPQGLRAALVTILAFAVVLTPWTIRNWVVFDRPVLVATNSGTAIAGANCDDTFYGDRLGGWSPPCIREHPGNEAEHHSEALRDGLRYAGDHLGRLPVVLAVRTRASGASTTRSSCPRAARSGRRSSPWSRSSCSSRSRSLGHSCCVAGGLDSGSCSCRSCS